MTTAGEEVGDLAAAAEVVEASLVAAMTTSQVHGKEETKDTIGEDLLAIIIITRQCVVSCSGSTK